MDFICYKCKKKNSKLSEALKHLKKIHFVTDHVDEIHCLVPECTKTFCTFDSLRTHLKSRNAHQSPIDTTSQQHVEENSVDAVNKI